MEISLQPARYLYGDKSAYLIPIKPHKPLFVKSKVIPGIGLKKILNNFIFLFVSVRKFVYLVFNETGQSRLLVGQHYRYHIIMARKVNRIILQIASTYVRGTSASALYKTYSSTFPLVPVEVFGHYYTEATEKMEATADPEKRAERAETFARTFLNLVDNHCNAMVINAMYGYAFEKVKVSKTGTGG
jgi:hypothetical protein